MLLEAKNVKKSFGGHRVLAGVSLQVEKGEVLAILGPSGSGKTTLLRCLNFLERADGGTLCFGGETVDLHRASHRQAAAVRRKTGFVFQDFNLFRNKTALENAAEGLIVADKIPPARAREVAAEQLERVGMLPFAKSYPWQLSGGQQQRVAIARAMARGPELVYFDEPTSALDPELTGEVLEVMRRLAGEGTTMLVVTHELGFARGAASRALLMEGGVIVEEGETERFFSAPREERTRQFLSYSGARP